MAMSTTMFIAISIALFAMTISVGAQNATCRPGTFGLSCEQECHCMKSSCDSTVKPVRCALGCQRGWLGDACNIRRIKPEVNYFCINRGRYANHQNQVPYVKIRVKTNGIEYVKLYTKTGGGFFSSCYPNGNDHKIIPGDTPSETVYTLRSDVQNPWEGKETHLCHLYKRPDKPVYEWRVQVRESESVTLENDLDVIVTCNFTQADNRLAEDNLTISEIPPESYSMEKTPDSLGDDVTLSVVNVTTDQPITASRMGELVKLRLTYGLVEGSVIHEVRPHSCYARAGNGSSGSASLIDDEGCSFGVVPQFNKTGANTLETGWFPVFDVGGSGVVDVQCSYNICFENEACGPICGVPNNRHPRDVRSDIPIDLDLQPARDLAIREVSVRVRVTKPEL